MWRVQLEEIETPYGYQEQRNINTDKTGHFDKWQLRAEMGETFEAMVEQMCTAIGDVFEFTSTANTYHIRVERI